MAQTSESSGPSQPRSSEEEAQAVPGANMFVTTSSILDQLNNNLKSLRNEGEQLEGRFELQKRLPDGSAVPASNKDIAASDCKTKLQQSAQFVAQLAPEDQLLWAHQQRQIANETFARGEYTQAMDLYLTCLVACPKQPDQEDALQAIHEVPKHKGAALDRKDQFLYEIVTPVLNNLSQCALQLGMYKKAIQFCDMALVEPPAELSVSKPHAGKTVAASHSATYVVDVLKHVSQLRSHGRLPYLLDPHDCASNESASTGVAAPTGQTQSPDPLLALCKLYFKRSKANRLSGNYQQARQDHQTSQDWLDQASTVNDSSSPSAADAGTAPQITTGNSDVNLPLPDTDYSSYQSALDKEHRLLQKAHREGSRNEQRQKTAMRKAMAATAKMAEATATDSSHAAAADGVSGLGTAREFSLLRDPSERHHKKNHNNTNGTDAGQQSQRQRQRRRTGSPPGVVLDDIDPRDLSYVQYYFYVVSRILESTIEWLDTFERQPQTKAKTKTKEA